MDKINPGPGAVVLEADQALLLHGPISCQEQERHSSQNHPQHDIS